MSVEENLRLQNLGAAAVREFNYRCRQALVASKQILRLSRRADKTFYVNRFDRALRAGRVGPNVAIMATGKDDGAGSQAQAAMSALCFARAHGLAYIHRPFTTIMHAETDMLPWVQAWEEYFNLGLGERCLGEDGTAVIAVDEVALIRRAEPMIVAAEHYLNYCNQDKDAWERVLPELRNKFWANKERRRRRDGEIRLAMHMRRGDVSAEDKKVARNFTPNAIFVNTLTRLKALLAGTGRRLSIQVFSQGDPSMFADLAALGAELKLDAPALDTHRALVDSDMLIMSKGAFSYTAGVLHEGITLYDPQKYRPLKGWIAREPDGAFDEALVVRRLAKLFPPLP